MLSIGLRVKKSCSQYSRIRPIQHCLCDSHHSAPAAATPTRETDLQRVDAEIARLNAVLERIASRVLTSIAIDPSTAPRAADSVVSTVKKAPTSPPTAAYSSATNGAAATSEGRSLFDEYSFSFDYSPDSKAAQQTDNAAASATVPSNTAARAEADFDYELQSLLADNSSSSPPPMPTTQQQHAVLKPQTNAVKRQLQLAAASSLPSLLAVSALSTSSTSALASSGATATNVMTGQLDRALDASRAHSTALNALLAKMAVSSNSGSSSSKVVPLKSAVPVINATASAPASDVASRQANRAEPDMAAKPIASTMRLMPCAPNQPQLQKDVENAGGNVNGFNGQRKELSAPPSAKVNSRSSSVTPLTSASAAAAVAPLNRSVSAKKVKAHLATSAASTMPATAAASANTETAAGAGSAVKKTVSESSSSSRARASSAAAITMAAAAATRRPATANSSAAFGRGRLLDAFNSVSSGVGEGKAKRSALPSSASPSAAPALASSAQQESSDSLLMPPDQSHGAVAATPPPSSKKSVAVSLSPAAKKIKSGAGGKSAPRVQPHSHLKAAVTSTAASIAVVSATDTATDDALTRAVSSTQSPIAAAHNTSVGSQSNDAATATTTGNDSFIALDSTNHANNNSFSDAVLGAASIPVPASHSSISCEPLSHRGDEAPTTSNESTVSMSPVHALPSLTSTLPATSSSVSAPSAVVVAKLRHLQKQLRLAAPAPAAIPIMSRLRTNAVNAETSVGSDSGAVVSSAAVGAEGAHAGRRVCDEPPLLIRVHQNKAIAVAADATHAAADVSTSKALIAHMQSRKSTNGAAAVTMATTVPTSTITGAAAQDAAKANNHVDNDAVLTPIKVCYSINSSCVVFCKSVSLSRCNVSFVYLIKQFFSFELYSLLPRQSNNMSLAWDLSPILSSPFRGM
jgi:hypothetical protein